MVRNFYIYLRTHQWIIVLFILLSMTGVVFLAFMKEFSLYDTSLPFMFSEKTFVLYFICLTTWQLLFFHSKTFLNILQEVKVGSIPFATNTQEEVISQFPIQPNNVLKM